MAMLLMMGASTTASAQIIKGKVFGGGKLAKVNGTTVADQDGNIPHACKVSLKAGDVYGEVYGAGEGLKSDETGYDKDVALVTGDVQVNLMPNEGTAVGTAWQNIYGGGALARVKGSTDVEISGGQFAADVFGGGEGHIETDASDNFVYSGGNPKITSADIDGTTTVNVTGGSIVWDRTSLSEEVDATVTTHIFTKKIAEPGSITYSTSDNAVTTETLKTYYEGLGYEGVTVAQDADTTVDEVTVHNFTISYTTKADVKTFTDEDLKEEGKTLEEKKTELSGYAYTYETEEKHYVTGEVISWDTNKPMTYKATVEGVKYDNSLFYDDTLGRFKIQHNIFGGGNIACNVTGAANVTMKTGLGSPDLNKTWQWKQAFRDDANPHFYVFGGGYGAYTTVKNTIVDVNVINYTKGYDAETDDQLAKGSEFEDDEADGPRRAINSGKPGDNDLDMGIFNNEYGIAGATVLGILGGSYAGFVKENTDVTVGGKTFARRVYGGGFGQLEEFNHLVNVGETAGKPNKLATTDYFHTKTRENLGMVDGDTKVVINGANIYGGVFGGGAGVASAWLDGSTYKPLDDSHETPAMDFTMGEVRGITDVTITEEARVFGDVFGGGDIANVTGLVDSDNDDDRDDRAEYTTLVKIEGGEVYGDVYGGGSGKPAAQVKGRVLADGKYSVPVGNIKGNARVHIYNGTDADDNEMTPTVYGDIYGGCAYGQVVKSTPTATDGVEGNAEVVVDGGNIGNNIFGGGHGDIDDSGMVTSANITGNTTVLVNGGSYMWTTIAMEDKANTKTFSDKAKQKVDRSMLTSTNPADLLKLRDIFAGITDFFDYGKKQFTRDHNIYGGGNVACTVGSYTGSTLLTKTGTADVTINHGMLDDDLGYADAKQWTVGALLRYLIVENPDNYQFGVFGGGYGPDTDVANTDVKIQIGREMIDGNSDDKDDYGYDNTKDKNTWDTFYEGLTDEFAAVDEATANKLYGGKEGANSFARYMASRMCWTFGVPNHTVLTVAGGGMAGYVKEDTKVKVQNHSGALRVFGGGIGLLPTELLATQLAADAYTYGQVAGNTDVTIEAGVISRNVFGGGAGIPSAKVDGSGKVLAAPTLTSTPAERAAYAAAEYRDFPNIALVKGKTNVLVDGYNTGTLVYGTVYGGGDVANVGIPEGKTGATEITEAQISGLNDLTDPSPDFTAPQSTVTVQGGVIFGEAYAGGYGRSKEQCMKYTRLGAIYGNSRIIFKNSEYTEAEATAENYAHRNMGDWTNKTAGDTKEPWIWARLFGGGNFGAIYGNTDVRIMGGNIGLNIFGGGVGQVGADEATTTSADVKHNTNITVTGGEYCLSQMWNAAARQWYPAQTLDGEIYSAQYDPKRKKFAIGDIAMNHNIYAGSRNCGSVDGDTYLTMYKGLLNGQTALGHPYKVAGTFFDQPEWKEIYEKVGSPHFCIFGGGFGENTIVKGNTHVNVDFDGAADIDGDVIATAVENSKTGNEQLYTLFKSDQSIMDVIGGGYSGWVLGATNVVLDGKTFIRRAFGGSFYAPVGQTNITVKKVAANNIFGGGMMGDVVTDKTNYGRYEIADFNGNGAVNVHIGVKDEDDAVENNDKVFITNDVYGGNDVSGEVQGEITVTLNGGKIFNNVYGAGNGNYLYAISSDVDKVTAHEHYPNPDDPTNEAVAYDLVYEVPMRDFMINLKDATPGQKLVNINSWRPLAQHTTINISGADGHPVQVLGSVFGGGNTATLSGIDDTYNPSVKFNIGSHINVGKMFMGADGEAMFDEKSQFFNSFKTINNLAMELPIKEKWDKDPAYVSIPETYLPVAKENRALVYPYLLDLYFSPVELSTQASLNWWGSIRWDDVQKKYVGSKTCPCDIEHPFEDATIGTFVCGGNRGNMNVEPYEASRHSSKVNTDLGCTYGGDCNISDEPTIQEGQVLNYTFPEGLKITGNIVGGCNDANYTPKDDQSVTHQGGYMLGKRGGETETNLTVKCKFDVAEGADAFTEGRNVYGGCYKTGITRGDIAIDFRASMLSTNNIGNNIAKIREDGLAIANIYGAGYGDETYVYGNTDITFGKKCKNTITTTDGKTTIGYGCTANYIYGGGQKGNLVGNSFIRVLNGHLASSAVGGSYSGRMWGSTHVLVGYPKYYVCQKSAKYYLTRSDKWNIGESHLTPVDADNDGNLDVMPKNQHADGREIVKQSIYLMEGDIVSEEVYECINGYQGDGGRINGLAASLQFDVDRTTKKNCFSDGKTADPYTDCLKGVDDDGITNTATAWNNIRIKMDEAAYGGGYSLSDAGGDAGAGAATVLKFNADQNINDELSTQEVEDLNNGTLGSIGYGGNTTVLVWDSTDQTVDHIDISSQTWNEVEGLTPGDDIFDHINYRYVYDPSTGSYQYVDKEGKFYFGDVEHATPDEKDAGKDSNGRYFRVFTSTSEGGVYGDGHLSFAEGFRAAELKGYGFAEHKPTSAKVINTLQRFDIMRIEDCAIVLLGARDYTVGNDLSTVPYSLARIGELQMIAKNVTKNSGKLVNTDPVTDAIRSRNYLGLSSNIYYLGAVNSNIDFNDTYHKGNKDGSANLGVAGDKTYREEKQEYITRFKDNDFEFQKRNDGTAANMIGISSGYALKVQNVFTDTNDKENFYYGPIIGVVEMNLINVHEDEGGGYVYADNIHHRPKDTSDPSPSRRKAPLSSNANPNEDDVPEKFDDDEDFLETSGNFVFPYNEKLHRYIVDDCFPQGYDDSKVAADGRATAEAHYWYVTGYNYFYNAHITGYTYNTELEAKPFYSNNKDGLLVLSGVVQGQRINLQSLTWSKPAAGEQDNRDIMSDPDVSKGKNGNTAVPGTDHPANHIEYDHYNLFMSAGIDSDTKRYTETNSAYWDYVPLRADLGIGDPRWFTNTAAKQDAELAFMLTDKVDNSGADYYEKYMKKPSFATIVLTAPAVEINDSHEIKTAEEATALNNAARIEDASGKKPGDPDYTNTWPVGYTQLVVGDMTNRRLADEDDVKNGLAETVGENIFDYDFVKGFISVKELYTDAECTTKLTTEPTSGVEYYYLGSEGGSHSYTYNRNKFYRYDETNHVYAPVEGLSTTTEITKEDYNNLNPEEQKYYEQVNEDTYKVKFDVPHVDVFDGEAFDEDYSFYIYDQRYFCYTIYLTIDYVQGPSYTGNIKIYNCALPGERIKIDRGTFKLDGDLTFTLKDSYWRFGPRVYNPETDSYTLDPDKYITYQVGKPYDPEHHLKDDTNILFPNSLDVTNDNSIELPAYYFMNGYGVQYVFTVDGLEGDNLFAVNMQPEDYLLIHNYHRMQPRRNNDKYDIELYIDRAADRAREDAQKVADGKMDAKDALPEPRIYIADAIDLTRFGEFMANTSRYKSGRNMQFFMQDDVTVPATFKVPETFNGKFNGDGHSLTFNNGNEPEENSVFKSLLSESSFYNLGVVNGVITQGDKMVAEPAVNPKYHCCFNYVATAPSASADGYKNVVYRIDGKPITTYSADDWRLGKVAYDLNQFYLERRLSKSNTADEPEAMAPPRKMAPPVYGGTGFEYVQTYVESLYANGDYLYARVNTGPGSEYLRTNASPNYNSSEATYHNTNHTIDAARAMDYHLSPEAFSGTYLPLIDEAHVNGTEATATTLRNDYIFFGQKIMKGATIDNGGIYPHAYSDNTPADYTHNSDADNRVFRAYGFHGNKEDRAYHFNLDAWALEGDLTAIDFTGYHEPKHPWWRGVMDGNVEHEDNNLQTSYPAVGKYIFYPQVMDMPCALTSFQTDEDVVSRNILVYTDASGAEAKSYAEVYKALTYNENTAEAGVHGHQIALRTHVADKPDYATALLHLVERTADGLDGEGNECVNNDFNAPIDFDVTQRAWYTRRPANYGGNTDATNKSADAWEGIALPFAVNRVTSWGRDYEMTHFYGAEHKPFAANDGDDAGTDPDNVNNVGHEYWLRGLVAMDNQDAKTVAMFRRPGLEADNTPEVPLFVQGSLSGDYIYDCQYLFDTYYNYDLLDKNQDFSHHDIYKDPRNYPKYVVQNADIPYLVRFPGERYKEFDLSGKHNAYLIDAERHSSEAWPNQHLWTKLASDEEYYTAPQSVTFNWYAVNTPHHADTPTAEQEPLTGPYTVNITDDVADIMTAKNLATTTYRHATTYRHIDAPYIYAVNDDGTAFDAAKTEVMPFRTYMTTEAKPAHAPQRIIIGGIADDINPQGDDDMGGDIARKLIVYAVGHNIIVESTYQTDIVIYTAAGQLSRAVKVNEGSNLYTGFAPGVYVIAGQKIVVR